VAVKYVCDRCDREMREWDVKLVRVVAPPDLPLAVELCPDCAKEVREYALTKRPADEGQNDRAAHLDREKEQSSPRPFAASISAALPLVRALVYVGIAAFFFFVGTWLSST
jgi:hypothetical protein